jgi:hypothetical protein
VSLLDRFRKKRNLAEYDAAGAVSPTEATEMLALARRLQTLVGEWLRSEHPDLM